MGESQKIGDGLSLACPKDEPLHLFSPHKPGVHDQADCGGEAI